MRCESVRLPVLGGEIELKLYIPDVLEGSGPLRQAVVICGGGGYSHISPRETEPVALRLAAHGINACTVAYRHAPESRWPTPVQDVGAAVAYLRAHAPAHHTDPRRVAVMGFSAGGHAAACVGVRWQDASFWAPCGLTPEQVHPNAMLLCYPVISAREGVAHRRSFEMLTGSADIADHLPCSVEDMVTPDAPPTFLWHTWDDASVPVENSLLLAQALRRAGVGAEVHLYQHGRHGLSLCDETTAGANPEGRIEPDVAGWFSLMLRFLSRLG